MSLLEHHPEDVALHELSRHGHLQVPVDDLTGQNRNRRSVLLGDEDLDRVDLVRAFEATRLLELEETLPEEARYPMRLEHPSGIPRGLGDHGRDGVLVVRTLHLCRRVVPDVHREELPLGAPLELLDSRRRGRDGSRRSDRRRHHLLLDEEGLLPAADQSPVATAVESHCDGSATEVADLGGAARRILEAHEHPTLLDEMLLVPGEGECVEYGAIRHLHDDTRAVVALLEEKLDLLGREPEELRPLFARAREAPLMHDIPDLAGGLRRRSGELPHFDGDSRHEGGGRSRRRGSCRARGGSRSCCHRGCRG